MDVRCERCATEYELDDDSVPPGGCPVQCTNCGHTFAVERPGGASATHAADSSPSPPAADWLLETSDGRLHRFRNLTSLQKWIIERKVTREDKISRTGHAWRRLGEIVELSPFFDVVDEADRARAAQAGHQRDDLKAEAERARRMGGGRASPAVAMAAVSPGPRSLTNRPSGSTPMRAEEDLSALDAWAADGDTALGSDNDTSVLPRRRTGLKVFLGLLAVAAVGAAAWLLLPGLTSRPVQTQAGVAEAPGSASPSSGSVAEAPGSASPSSGSVAEAPGSASPSSGSVAEAPGSASPSSGSVAGAPGSPPSDPVAEANGPQPTTPSRPDPVAPGSAAAPLAARPNEAAAAASPSAVPAPAAAPGAAGAEAPFSYERLLGDADRLLENDSPDRAAKIYERALKLKPRGPEALAGLGYVMLDKDRISLAIGYFERALAQAPSFGPAMFGLAEAYRAQGQDSRALQVYENYLQVNSTGVDAPAARRQVTLLRESLSAAKPAAPVPERVNPVPAPAAPVPVPVPVPAPASVLGDSH